jgi:hypothetical protein
MKFFIYDAYLYGQLSKPLFEKLKYLFWSILCLTFEKNTEFTFIKVLYGNSEIIFSLLWNHHDIVVCTAPTIRYFCSCLQSSMDCGWPILIWDLKKYWLHFYCYSCLATQRLNKLTIMMTWNCSNHCSYHKAYLHYSVGCNGCLIYHSDKKKFQVYFCQHSGKETQRFFKANHNSIATM